MWRLNPVLAATFMRLVASVVLLGLLTVRIAAQDKEFEELKRLFDYNRGRPIDLVAGRRCDADGLCWAQLWGSMGRKHRNAVVIVRCEV
jgi:hypothetical protein